MSNFMSRFISFVAVTLMTISASSFAQTPTPQQIEQFKKLPRAQQQQIARQFGIDLDSINSLGGMSQDAQLTQESITYPRGTSFDEFGNPVEPNELNKEEKEGELSLYGIDLFAHEPMTFTPIDDLPVPLDYRIGPGDQLMVQLFGKENAEYELVVNRDGKIVVPKLGPISVASQTFEDVQALIKNKMQQQIIGVEVSVSLGNLRTMRVYVMGEAYKPGAYNVSSLSTITHALFASGGVSEIASLRNIQLKRNGKLVTTFDLYDLLNHGDSSDDVQLQAGDVVFIPPVKDTVTIDGQVRRPAIYELKGEKTLNEAIALAGGKLPEGYGEAISIKRFINGVQLQVTADLTDSASTVRSGDEIRVPKVTPYVSQSVSLIGAVARPGKYEWKNGLRIGDLLGNLHRDVLEDADLSYVLILREYNRNRDIRALQTDLTDVVEGVEEANLPLQMNDTILVFSRVESELLGDVNLQELAYIEEEIEERQKKLWEKHIEDKQFWESVGLNPKEISEVEEVSTLTQLQDKTSVELSVDERNRVLQYKDATYFSRKRMLSPVIAKLKEQARFGEPLQIVEVAGEVKNPGLYPLTENADVNALIKAAGGLTESTYPLKSEITRTVISNDGVAEVAHIGFSPGKVVAGEQVIELKSKDRVNLFSVPSWQEELKVKIMGEVEFPGEYTIRRGETLSDLVARAGGLTSYGNPNAAVFTRESLKEQERKNLRSLAEELRKQIASESLRRKSGAGAMVSYDEAKKLLNDLTKTEAVGRLVIDFESVIKGNESADVALENGDVLYVPGETQSVNVIGEVYVPTSHLYTAGLNYEDYIARSGGFRSLADEGNTYIIRANGQVDIPDRDGGFWFSGDSAAGEIRPGDTIVVPFDSDNVDNMSLWANATQIVYQLAVAVAAIGSL
ncbi:SLBB domain-containing protein [Aestuariibacter sp. AA17]|uniref:SLBB domain-containing protein n=1 Tax=Fluctibacter corallii TaxID=2984329 RepID=A0ABT3A3S0_9ALTE|nr:SLBB domain-containing protein [Aestuariibacter sp. AA17]MCV2883298.1 SLBB domain-containing protein [Aestuariibacter sp. AA17]